MIGKNDSSDIIMFDVFLSYYSLNRDIVTKIANTLKNNDLRVWLDIWELPPGSRWQEAIEEIILITNSAIVFVGEDGIGPWEDLETRACLNQFVKRKMTLIPVLLPGNYPEPELPLFLQEFTWLDLRRGINLEKISSLVWGITGKKPIERQPIEINKTTHEINYSTVVLNALKERIDSKRYILTDNSEYIHQGSIALVCRAYDKQLHRYVAVKVLAQPSDEARQHFVETTLSGLEISDATHCITIYDAHLYDQNPKSEAISADYPYLIMQYIGDGVGEGGKSLRKFIDISKTNFSPEEVRKIILMIGRTLLEINEPHMNIKPSNIMLKRVQSANKEINYFGDRLFQYEPFISPLMWNRSSKTVDIISSLENRLNNVNEYRNLSYLLEDFAYLPPELFCSVWTTNKVDQYLIGLLAYELLTGNMPNTLDKLDITEIGDDPIEFFKDIIHDLRKRSLCAFKALDSINREDCPDSLIEAILKMTAINPKNRYDNLKDAIDVIDRDYEFLIVKDSLRRCMKNSKFLKSFYLNFKDRLNRNNPGKFEILFERIDKGEKYPEYYNNTDMNWEHHYGMLRESILFLLAYYDQDNKTDYSDFNILSRIASFHTHIHKEKNSQTYRIDRNDFLIFKDTLIDTACGDSGDIEAVPFDDLCKDINRRETIRFCWQKVLSEGISYMQDYLAKHIVSV